MGALKQYNPKEVIATWDGVDLASGAVSGTFITVVPNARDIVMNVSPVDGGGTIVTSEDRSAVVEITVRSGSKTNDALSKRVNDARGGNRPVKPLSITDFSGTSLHSCAQAVLDGPPEDAFASDEGTRVWRFLCHKMDSFAGGNQDA